MAAKVIALGGEPATGKTTLFKHIRACATKTFSYGLVRGVHDGKGNYFIGVFDGSTFEGTDKLSMAVQPHFITFINSKEGVVFFEGDRLFNNSLFEKLTDKTVIVIKCSGETLKSRNEARNDTQPAQFKKAKRTKIQNIIDKQEVIIMNNDTIEDTEKIIQLINSFKQK